MNVVRMVRPEISEAAQIEIDRWQEVADRNYEWYRAEKASKWQAAKWALLIGIVLGAATVLVWQ